MKIQTSSEKAIDETIETGQIIRNGSGRGFRMEVQETTVRLDPINDTSGKSVVLSRKVFCQLFYRKNYAQVPEGVDPLKDSAVSASIGSNRFLVK